MKIKKYRVSKKRQHLYKLTYTIYDFYQNYEKKDKISKEKYIGILKDFYQELVNNVIIGRKRITLPMNLGVHRIQKIKQSLEARPRIDFNKTKQYKKTIYHLNMHSAGFYFMWRWDRGPLFIKNKQYYIFKLTKTKKAELAKEIVLCNSDPYKKDYNALR